MLQIKGKQLQFDTHPTGIGLKQIKTMNICISPTAVIHVIIETSQLTVTVVVEQ